MAADSVWWWIGTEVDDTFNSKSPKFVAEPSFYNRSCKTTAQIRLAGKKAGKNVIFAG